MLSEFESTVELPIISVVLPVFNAERYVDESICSILDQTFTNFELIIINDGSTDSTLGILEKFKQQDKRVILVSRENRGLVETLNEGISIARGKWLARMDADDIALPNRFEQQLKWLKSTGADIAGSWVRCFGASDKRVIRRSQTDEGIKMAMLFCSPFAHPSVMMKTELVRQLSYDKAWQQAQDYDLWVRAVEAGWKMTNVPEVLLLYRLHESQISNQKLQQQRQFALQIQRRYWQYVFRNMQLDQRLIDDVLDIYELTAWSPNMDTVDAVFHELLRRNHGEARATVLEHATSLYIRASANCPDIVARWGKLHREYGKGLGLATKINLWMFQFLRIRMDGNLYNILKKIYIWIT